MNTIFQSIRDMLYLLYPEYCAACNQSAPLDNHIFCLSCLYELPFTDHFKIEQHELMLRFMGRQEVIFSAALFEMHRGGLVQEMIHNFKYRKRKEIGLNLGKQYGRYLIQLPICKDIDYMIPVPLHRHKFMHRGFNQSTVFAKGIGEITDIPVLTDTFVKVKNTDSQTQMGRSLRLQNVKDSFKIKNASILSGKHILLVDDVVTTGATLEACMMKIRESVNVRISIAIIALTKH